VIIVSNTGPLLHLYEAGCLHVLDLSGEIHTPETVVAELSFLLPDFKFPGWIQIDPLEGSYQQLANSWQQAGILDPGEAEALCLAQQLKTNWFLTDDASARILAVTLKIEVHGSLGVILWAAASGYFKYVEATEYMEKLAGSSLWISPRIISEAHKALKTIFGWDE
jgi:predicted nucleic acid-binding protein